MPGAMPSAMPGAMPGMMPPVMGGRPMGGTQFPAARGSPLVPRAAGPEPAPTQIVKPYDYSQAGSWPMPTSAYSMPIESDPLTEIGFDHSPLDEFGMNPFDKRWAKALTDPEADPRFGAGYKKGFQIDPTPFKMKQKAEKRKAKMRKQPKSKKGKDPFLKFNETEISFDQNAAATENSIPTHYHDDYYRDRYYDDRHYPSEDSSEYYDDGDDDEYAYRPAHHRDHYYDEEHYMNEFTLGRGGRHKSSHPSSSRRHHFETTDHEPIGRHH